MRTLAVVLSTLLAACTLHAKASFQVDGVELPASHEETLGLAAWPPGGLEIHSSVGDVSVVPGDTNSVHAVLHEVTEGDARLRMRGRTLAFETSSGQPAAIGTVTVTVREPLPTLSITTGVGHVRTDLVEILGALAVNAGTGDILILGGRAGDRVDLETAMGDIQLTSFEGTVVEASTGLGEVELREVRADRADLRSGMGDVRLTRSAVRSVAANTGLGDVVLLDSAVEESDLETGLGDIIR